jgi:hypothetical protein
MVMNYDASQLVSLLALVAQPVMATEPVPAANAPESKRGPKTAPARLFLTPPLNDQALAPGLYKTEPYTCLVLVPGKHPDDIALKGGTLSTNLAPIIPRMPSKVPEQRFTPWPTVKR